MVASRPTHGLVGLGLLIVCVLAVVVIHAALNEPGPPVRHVAGCTITVGDLPALQSAVARARGGSVVCVIPGRYAHLTLSRTVAGGANVIVEPVLVGHPARTAKVIFSGLTVAGSDITVRNVYSTAGITVGGSPAVTHDAIAHDDVTNPYGYGISIMSPFAKPASDITISANRIHATCSTCEGDALRLDGWRNVTIAGNDIYDIRECPANACHTDTLQSYQGDVPTEGLTVIRNYVHDTVNVQGLPFLKDGDIQHVRIYDNLSVRMASTGQTNGPGIDEDTVGLRITRNTYVRSGGYLQAGGTATGASAYVAGNLFNSFNIQPPLYTLSQGHNIYTGNNQWSFTLGRGSAVEARPRFMCGLRCGNGTAQGDDYRLVGYNDPRSPDYGIGIDWAPVNQQYGPVQ